MRFCVAGDTKQEEVSHAIPKRTERESIIRYYTPGWRPNAKMTILNDIAQNMYMAYIVAGYLQ